MGTRYPVSYQKAHRRALATYSSFIEIRNLLAVGTDHAKALIDMKICLMEPHRTGLAFIFPASFIISSYQIFKP